MNPLRRLLWRINGRPRLRAPEVEAAARAKRARDHLARKRERERHRLSRERTRHEIEVQRLRLLRIASPIAFALAAWLGATFSAPISQFTLLGNVATERVAVQGADTLSSAAIAAATGLSAGVPLGAVDPAGVEASLVAHPWIEEARAIRLPTGTLVVGVVEQDAIARWRGADDLAWVDPSGSRFANATPEPQASARFNPGALPTIEGEPEAGDALSKDALLILREVRKHAALAADPAALTLHLPGLDTNSEGILRASPAGFVLQVGQEGPRALLGRRLLSQRVARLAALLEHDEETARAARLIDLRYADRAVLRTAPASG